MTYTVAAFYKFVALPDFESRQPALAGTLDATGVKGTVLLASEGVNGTIAGTAARRWKPSSPKPARCPSCA